MKIETTDNYEQFTFIPENRPIFPPHVELLKAHFALLGHFDPCTPMKVTPDFRIIEGQHRFLAAKSLGYKVCYVISHEDPIQAILNHQGSTRKWSKEDYLHYWVTRGNANYKIVKELKETFELSIEKVISCVKVKQSNSLASSNFKNGSFEVDDDLAYYIEILSKAVDIQKTIKYHKGSAFTFHDSDRFWYALLDILRNPQLDFELFKQKLVMLVNKLHPCVSRVDYYSMLKDIYNYRNRKGI